MNWLNIAILLVNIVILGIICFYQTYIKKIVSIITSREESYESEKGKNIATKEDIEEITSKMESIRVEISFEAQRRNKSIEEQEKRMLNIAFHSQVILSNWNNVLLYSKHWGNVNRLYEIIKEINDNTLQLTHLANIILASYKNPQVLDPLVHLVDEISTYALEICSRAQNIATLLSIDDKLPKMVNTPSEYGNVMTQFLNEYMPLIDKIISDEFKFRQSSRDALMEYLKWLNTLYQKDFNIKVF